MLLESMKIIVPPASTETLIIFPFDQCNIKFRREVNENVFQGRYSEREINRLLDEIEANCDHFWILKTYIMLTLLTSMILTIAVIMGSIFLNLGYKNKDSGVDFVKYESNYYVYTGGVILGIGGLQFILLMIWISFKSRYIRLFYEEKANQIIQMHNETNKDIGIWWRLGDYLRWIEVRLDFKIKMENYLMHSSTIDISMKSPTRKKSNKEINSSILFQPDQIKLDVD